MPDDFFDYSEPRRRPVQAADTTPWLTYMFIAFSVLATLPVLAPGLLPAPVGAILSAANQPPEAIWSGQVWAMLSTAFVHGGLLHLAFNMLWLYQLGTILELSLGRWKYAALVVAAALAGSGAEIMIDGQTGVGMSGVVYALFGLMWAGKGMYPAWGLIANRQNLWYLIGWGLFCVVATALHLFNVANAAHGAGFLLGLSAGYLFLSPRRRWIWAVPLALLVIMTVLSATYLPWSAEWRDWKATQSQR